MKIAIPFLTTFMLICLTLPAHGAKGTAARGKLKTRALKEQPLRRAQHRFRKSKESGRHLLLMRKESRLNEARLLSFKKNPNKAVFDVIVVGMGPESNREYNIAQKQLGRNPHMLVFEQDLRRTVEGKNGYRDSRFYGWDLGWSALPLRRGAQLVGDRQIVSIVEVAGGFPAKYQLTTNHGDVVWANRIAMEWRMNRAHHWTHNLPVTRLVRSFLAEHEQQPLTLSPFELPSYRRTPTD
jgi:hypothetical protein